MTAKKRTVSKKTASKKMSASASEGKPRVDEARNAQARATKDASKMPKPKIHAKSLTFSISVGTEDRARTIEKFIEEIEKKIGKVPYGEPGVHASLTSAYYILDGKVCLPEDYDPKTQNFKKGAVPPPWAGGPTSKQLASVSNQEKMAEDARNLSSDEYDKKYGIGKYAPQFADKSRLITPEMQKQKREEYRAQKEAAESEGLEELDWDADDIHDEALMTKVADESASQAVKKLKSSKKRVVKKSTPKKTVKVKKK